MNTLSASQTVANLSVVPLLISRNTLISSPRFVANCSSCNKLVFSLHLPVLPLAECKCVCNSTSAWSVIAITHCSLLQGQQVILQPGKNLTVSRIYESENKMCIPVFSDL